MTTGYRIDKEVPIPKRIQKQIGRKTKYPFGRMKVGDSFFVPKSNATAQLIYNAAYQHTKRKGGAPKFLIRVVEGGCRCWRVADHIEPTIITYPVPPRLSPDGTYYICDHCGREWQPGTNPGCDNCAAALTKD